MNVLPDTLKHSYSPRNEVNNTVFTDSKYAPVQVAMTDHQYALFELSVDICYLGGDTSNILTHVSTDL